MLVKIVILAVALGVVSSQNPTIVNVNVPESGRLTFQSTNYPALYPANQNVHYVITGPKGLGLQFDIEFFDLDLYTDSFFLTEIIVGRGAVAFGTVAGKDGKMPTTFRSATHEVVGIFKSDSSQSGGNKGFKIGVQATRALAELTDSLQVNCTRGKLTWSEPKFLETDKAHVYFAVDRTIKCRSIMHDAHTFILKQLGGPEAARSIIARPIAVTCDSKALKVSEDKPDDSEAEDLTFKTTANLNCRQIFVKFLDHISKL